MKYTLLASSLALAALAGQASAQIYSTDFSTLDGWTVTTGCMIGYEWAADATPAGPSTYPYDDYPTYTPFVSAPASLNFNNGLAVGFPIGVISCGSVISPPIDLSSSPRIPLLRFMVGNWTEGGCHNDILSMQVLPVGGGAALLDVPCMGAKDWGLLEFELDASWGVVQIEFSFDTVDSFANTGPGPCIDDLEIIDRCGIDPQSPCDDFLSFCFGDGSGTLCPCSNGSAWGEKRGCRNSSGEGARLVPSGAPDTMADTLRFVLEGAPASSFAFLVSADNPLPMTAPGMGFQDNDGLRCVGGNLLRHGARATDLAGRSGFGTPGWGGMDNPAVGLIAQYGFGPGQSRYFQIFVRDDVNSICGTGLNRSNGVKVTFQ